MSFLVDTDTCSHYLRGHRVVSNRFLQYGGRLHVSVVTLAELHFWLFRRGTAERYRQAYLAMRREVVVLDLNEPTAEEAGKIGADLRDRGMLMDTPDLLIGVTALVHGLTVVTHNTRDFNKVPGLRVVDWMVP